MCIRDRIDSIKILYPKAFEARKAGQALMLDVETKAQQKTLAYLDSAFQAKTEEFNAIKDKFKLEKDAEYQQVGNYLWPTPVSYTHLRYLRTLFSCICICGLRCSSPVTGRG